MDSSGLGKTVLEDDPDTVALISLNRRSWRTAVEAPQVEGPAGYDELLHGLGGQMEHLSRRRRVCTGKSPTSSVVTGTLGALAESNFGGG